MKKNILNFVSASALSLLMLASCNKVEDIAPSIAAIAVANPAFSVLEDAAIRGGVAGVLSNKNPNDAQGNFTVFAPTNDAFARLGLNSAADLNALNKTFLTNTLLYHTSNGATAGTSLTAGSSLPSLLGPTKRFVKRGNDLYVNGRQRIEVILRREYSETLRAVPVFSPNFVKPNQFIFQQSNDWIRHQSSSLI